MGSAAARGEAPADLPAVVVGSEALAAPFLGRTVPDLLYGAHERHPNRAVLLQRLGTRRFRPVSLQELRVQVEDIALGLRALGLARGDRVALLLRSDTDFLRVDLGCLLGGLVDVPVYLDLAPEAARVLIQHSGAVAVAVADTALLSRFANALEATAVRVVVLCRPDPMAPDDLVSARASSPAGARVISLAALCGEGQRKRGDDSDAPARLRAEVAPADLATIVYTSGTTGQPKGVMLSQQNLSFDALAALDGFTGYRPGEGGEVVLSFLPLAHAFQRTLCYGALSQGTSIAFTEPDHLSEDLAFVRPTLFAAVPRVLEKARERITARVESTPGARGRLARWALARAERHDPRRSRRGVAWLRQALADVLVYRRWRAAFGGRVRFVIAGGAAVARDLVDFFGAAGVEVLQGYGQTETSPVIAYNRPGRNRSGTVGEPLPGVEVRVAADGEVLTRGPHVMQGYFRDESATRAVLDPDRWLHTGDRGALDAAGFLHIAGRIKDEFKLSTGKFVFPEPTEKLLERDPLVEHAVIYGAGRPYCVALLFLEPAPTRRWALAAGLEAQGASEAVLGPELLAAPALLARCRDLVSRANDGADRWAHIQRFTLLSGPLTVVSGLLTPTLKVRRLSLAERFAAELGALYAAAPTQDPPAPVGPWQTAIETSEGP